MNYNEIYKDLMARLGEWYTQRDLLTKQIETTLNQISLLDTLAKQASVSDEALKASQEEYTKAMTNVAVEAIHDKDGKLTDKAEYKPTFKTKA